MNDINDKIITLNDEAVLPLALNGTITEVFRTGYAVQVTWSVNSQNVANNTSNVTVKSQLVSLGSYYTISSSATKNGSLTINGTTYNFTFSASLSANQTKTVYTKTVDIPHNSDGTKTFSVRTSLGIAVTLSGTYYGTVSTSSTGSGTLNTIPRSSSLSLSASSLNLGSAVTATISKASSSFYHKVWYKFGSINKEVYKGITSSTSQTVSVPTSISDSSQIPNSTSGTATITLETYSDSSYSNKVGSVSKSITVNVPSSVVPTIGGVSTAPVAAGAATSFGYVKGKSKCLITINNPLGAHGSKITSYSISGAGFSSTSNTLTTGVLNTAGSFSFTATITDSRGRKATVTTPAITVQDYNVPSINSFSVQRCYSTGTVADDGTHLRILSTYGYTTLGGLNKLTTKVEYKLTTASTWTSGGSITSGTAVTIGAGAISTNYSYDVRLTLTDSFTSTSKSVIIPTAYAIMDIRKGGKGIAFGKSAEVDGLVDIGMNLKVNDSVLTNYLKSFDNTKTAIQMTDGWLRLNPTNNFSSGIYCNTGILRTDGNFQVGSSGSTFNCSSSAFTYKGKGIYYAGNEPNAYDVGAYARSEWDSSKATNGYCKFPNGVIVQWGYQLVTVTAANTVMTQDVTFPIAFPSACRSVQISPRTTVPNIVTCGTTSISTSGFQLTMTRTNTTDTGYSWFAIGY